MNLTDATARSGIPTQTINSFRVTGGVAMTLATSSTLTLASGGLMATAASVSFPNAAGSALTSGTDNLFVYTSPGASLNLGVRVANNGATPIGLVKGGPGTLQLSATANTYTGTTFVNAGILQLNNASSGVQIPGDLVLAGDGATVTMLLSQGQIASTSRVSILGGGTMTLFGTNTLAGSIIEMDACVSNFAEFTGCSLAEAIDAATIVNGQIVTEQGNHTGARPGRVIREFARA